MYNLEANIANGIRRRKWKAGMLPKLTRLTNVTRRLGVAEVKVM